MEWSNPHSISLAKGTGVIYFIRVFDGSNREYCYIGQTRDGKTRLDAYINNIRRIKAGKPRRTTPGQEKYRAVHFALSKADDLGWNYDFYPIENAPVDQLSDIEKQKKSEYNCNLNDGQSWSVEDYEDIDLGDLISDKGFQDISETAPSDDATEKLPEHVLQLWEYKVVEVVATASENMMSTWNETLVQLGKEGWELSHIERDWSENKKLSYLFVLKRPVSPDTQAQ